MHCQLLVRLSILNLLWRTNVWCFIFSAGYSVSSKKDSPKNRLVKECLHCGSVDGILFCVWTFAISFQIGRFSSPFFSCYFFGIISLNSIMFQEMVFELFVIKKERKTLKETTHQCDIVSIENILEIFCYFDFDWIRFFGPSLPCSFSSIHFPSFGQHDWGRITIRSWGQDLLPKPYHSFQVFSFFRLCTSGFLVDSSL